MKYIITTLKEHMFAAKFHEDTCVELKPVTKDSIAGNIYIAKVENVVKNINCAFLEIQEGVKCYYSLDDNRRHLFLNRKNNTAVNQGDLLLVQVSTDAIKTKPATASDKITLAGKYLVLSTDIEGVNISKKTQSNQNCRMLKNQLKSSFDFNVLQENPNVSDNQKYIGQYGFILRTNSAEADPDTVMEEACRLVKRFEYVVQRALFGKAFTCVYEDSPIYVSDIMDIRSTELEEVITDMDDVYSTIIDMVPSDTKEKLRFYKDELLPLRSLYSLQKELDQALNKRVWLRCGGYIVIEQTEALTVIDVNTGKFVAGKGSEESKAATLLKVNMEAAEELARQLRLRNISGIVIVDFINMKSDEEKDKLLSYLKSIIKNDTVICTVVDITKLGLVEMTRQKNGKSLMEYKL